MVEKLAQRPSPELGAETVQLAIAMPLFLMLALAFAQIAVMAFSVLTLSGQIEQAAWAVDVARLEQASSPQEADEIVSQAIAACSGATRAGSVVVSNSAFTRQEAYSRRQVTPILKLADRTSAEVDDLRRRARGRYVLDGRLDGFGNGFG